MPRAAIDRELRKAIRDARRMIQSAEKADVNEAETRRRIERIFESIMGYDPFIHLSREHAVRGAGETEHVDFSIQLEAGESAKPIIMVEVKRVSIDLSAKHLRQAASYAIDAGCEWILLTNSKEWRLYHVSFGKPPETKHMFTWDILADDIPEIAQRFELISYKSLKKDALGELWTKTNVLLPDKMLRAMLCKSSINILRRELKRSTGVSVTPEDIVGGVRRLLNEAALVELENIHLTLPERKPGRTKPKAKETPSEPSSPGAEGRPEEEKGS